MMSVSKWAYEPEECDDGYCAGDCDLCFKQFMHLKHIMKREAIVIKIRDAVSDTVDRLNEIQEERSIKRERGMFE